MKKLSNILSFVLFHKLYNIHSVLSMSIIILKDSMFFSFLNRVFCKYYIYTFEVYFILSNTYLTYSGKM